VIAASGLATSDAPTATEPSGLLAIDKPAGVTSHDVVDKARRRLRIKRVGHLGTLDPGASGLLLLAYGAATRCATVWQGGEKTYEATIRFGVVTSTQDLQGEVLETRSTDGLDEPAVREISRRFVGEQLQVPPMVSALKVGGERLYRIARRGETVDRAARPVRVVEWTWLSIALPEASCRIRCSGGTYVRTLAHDLGQALGTGAALRTLRRLRSEPFGLDRAASLRDLDRLDPAEVLERFGVPLDRALDVLPEVRLDAEDVERVGHGGRPRLDLPPDALPLGAGPRSIVLRDPTGRALGLGEGVGDAGATRLEIRPHVIFPWAVRSGRAASDRT
jgi:tRNA pseudouridine55 synthase